MSSTPSEFQIIKQYFEGVGESNDQVIELGIGDDCALVNIPQNKSLCFSLDTMVEGRHFPVDAPPEKLAKRVIAAALSDLAAMGASPSFFTLSLTIPDAKTEWLEPFARGLRFMAESYSISLVGGDTTRGPLTIGVQVHGLVDKANELRRSGAKEGDLLVVTGTLGDAGAALALLDKAIENEVENHLLDRYYQPTPRFKESRLISSLASACIDVSDGLLADARHIAEASACGLEVDLDALPISKQLLAFKGDEAKMLALTAGDDYELLFTVSEEAWSLLRERNCDLSFSVIGRVVSKAQGVRVFLNEKEVEVSTEGFKHFE